MSGQTPKDVGMGTLHLAPGDSAAGSLHRAFREAGLNEEILTIPDDLSCGPIRALDAGVRTAWWSQFYAEDIFYAEEIPELEIRIAAFWDRLAAADGRIVVWAGRRSAMEATFLLAVADKLGDRPFSIIDVTELGLPPPRGPNAEFDVSGAVSLLEHDVLRTLIGTERPLVPEKRAAMREQWRMLQQEDAPFRIATGASMVSVTEDYFDAALLTEARAEPRKVARVVGGAMVQERTLMQVGDLMLLARLVALVKMGKLVADGDPWDMQTCRVWLPC